MGGLQSKQVKAGRKMVLVLGGGHAGVRAAQALDKMDMFNVILIDRKDFLHHDIAAPRAVVEPGFEEDILIPFTDILTEGSVVKAEAIDINEKEVTLKGWDQPVAYDYLILAAGSSYSFPTNVHTERSQAIGFYTQMQRDVAESKNIMIIGGGAMAAELAGEIKSAFPDKTVRLIHAHHSLVDHESHFNPGLAGEVESQLEALGVEVILNDRAHVAPLVASHPELADQFTPEQLIDKEKRNPYKMPTSSVDDSSILAHPEVFTSPKSNITRTFASVPADGSGSGQRVENVVIQPMPIDAAALPAGVSASAPQRTFLVADTKPILEFQERQRQEELHQQELIEAGVEPWQRIAGTVDQSKCPPIGYPEVEGPIIEQIPSAPAKIVIMQPVMVKMDVVSVREIEQQEQKPAMAPQRSEQVFKDIEAKDGRHPSYLKGERRIHTENGTVFDVDMVFFCTGGTSNMTAFKGFFKELSPDGRIKVNSYLQSSISPNIFAIGDAGDASKLGFYSSLHADLVAENIRRFENKQDLLPFIAPKPSICVSVGPNGGAVQLPFSTNVYGAPLARFIKAKEFENTRALNFSGNRTDVPRTFSLATAGIGQRNHVEAYITEMDVDRILTESAEEDHFNRHVKDSMDNGVYSQEQFIAPPQEPVAQEPVADFDNGVYPQEQFITPPQGELITPQEQFITPQEKFITPPQEPVADFIAPQPPTPAEVAVAWAQQLPLERPIDVEPQRQEVAADMMALPPLPPHRDYVAPKRTIPMEQSFTPPPVVEQPTVMQSVPEQPILEQPIVQAADQAIQQLLHPQPFMQQPFIQQPIQQPMPQPTQQAFVQDKNIQQPIIHNTSTAPILDRGVPLKSITDPQAPLVDKVTDLRTLPGNVDDVSQAKAGQHVMQQAAMIAQGLAPQLPTIGTAVAPRARY